MTPRTARSAVAPARAESPPLADQAARDRIRGDFDTTLIVEAASGTGKTSELVHRIVEAVAAGRARLDRVVAVTFTDMAAGELKLRLRTGIERRRQDPSCPPPERERLIAALPQLEEAHIGTIHSFCTDLLRERPVEAGVDPLFEVAPADAAAVHFDRVFDRWFESQLAGPGEGVRRILRRDPRRARGPIRDEGPRRLLRNAAYELAERRDFPTPWRRDEGFDREREIDEIMEEMADLGANAARGNPDDYFTQSLAAIDGFAAEATRLEAVRGRDFDSLEARLSDFRTQKHWNWSGFSRAYRDFPKAELKTRRDALKARLDAFVDAAGADLAPRLREDLWPVVEDYERLKAHAGCLDFLDLLLRARDLVRDNPTVRTQLQSRYGHIFVDEFQDTDPLQAEVLLLLSADDPGESDWRRVRPVPGKLFVVGDPKQSIYRFRRADVALYETIKRQLVGAGAELVNLNVSFRAVPEIQAAVNAAFEPRMRGGSASQPEYVPLMPFRSGTGGQPAIVALPVPAPYGDFRKIVKWKIEESLPDAVGAFVHWLVHSSGWTVTESDRPGVRVPIEPQHVCLLFRRFRSFFTDVTREYVRALEARHLPHLLVGGSSFHVREEIEAIRNALLAIERPEDELSVFATLKGPLFALDDGSLLAFKERCGSLHPFRRPPGDLPESLLQVADALALLRELHRRRNRRPIADTIGSLLSATRAQAGLANWPTGEQALANVARLADLARRAERRGVTSFRAFVERLVEQAEDGEAGSAPMVEDRTEAVRIMTVHGAKGLEFPVVVLADLTARDTPTEPSRWIDPERRLCAFRIAGCLPAELIEHRAEELERERDEAARVLYVAATRARDLLVVPAVGDERQEGWLATLNPVIHPPDSRCQEPEDREPPGCPSFGFDSVAKRPADVVRPAHSVVPGLHRPEQGTHAVAWWDPSALDLDVRESVGLVQMKILQADENGRRSEEGIRAHAAWREARARVRAEASAPSLRIATATERSREALPLAREVEVISLEGAGPRPGGRRFGTLVHAVLATVDLSSPDPDVESLAAFHGRLLGAPAEEVDAAGAWAAKALAHPLLERAAAAARRGDCRREVPLAHRLEDGTLLESVADLAFLEREPKAVWNAVDFKTDADPGERLERYRRQVALYAEAIERATGLPARATLLRL